jgi:hypothetical protein
MALNKKMKRLFLDSHVVKIEFHSGSAGSIETLSFRLSCPLIFFYLDFAPYSLWIASLFPADILLRFPLFLSFISSFYLNASLFACQRTTPSSRFDAELQCEYISVPSMHCSLVNNNWYNVICSGLIGGSDKWRLLFKKSFYNKVR